MDHLLAWYGHSALVQSQLMRLVVSTITSGFDSAYELHPDKLQRQTSLVQASKCIYARYHQSEKVGAVRPSFVLRHYDWTFISRRREGLSASSLIINDGEALVRVGIR